MDILTTREAVRARRAGRQRDKIALIPTMGALHEGHLSHVERCREIVGDRQAGGEVWVSVFVNPTQFGPGEDLEKYPRQAQRDAALLRERGVDAVWMPPVEEMYPHGSDWAGAVSMTVPGVAGVLEGERRPVHFEGVCRVVMKLLQQVQPGVMTLGEKDYQQLRVVSAMVADLDVPVEVVAVKTVREADGLAMSSRNRYLEPESRERAGAMAGAWAWAEEEVRRRGVVSAEELERGMRARLEEAGFEVDYAVVRDAATLDEVTRVGSATRPALSDLSQASAWGGGEVRAMLAGRLGGVRLIDNAAVGFITNAALPSEPGG